MEMLVKFYAAVVKLALVLAAMGVLKDATLAMAGKAAHARQHDMISYAKFSRMLTAPVEKTKAHQVR